MLTTLKCVILAWCLMELFSAIRPRVYPQHRLNELCSNSTEKVMFSIDTMPRVFSLSSTDLTKARIPFLYCHVDLYLPSKAYGVSVYIEEMRLSGSYQNCSEDFLQFGRDVLFITTHLSDKVCGTIQPTPAQASAHQLQNGNTSSSGRDRSLSQYNHNLGTEAKMRNYREETDSEMDIWVFMTPEADQHKHLSILMTPFRKICDPQDHFYRACEKKNRRCVRTELWCDGRPNCPPSADNTYPDEVDCPRDQPPKMKQEAAPGSGNHVMAVTIIIVISILVTSSLIITLGIFHFRRNLLSRRRDPTNGGSGPISRKDGHVMSPETESGDEARLQTQNMQIRLGRSYQDMLYEGVM